MVQTTKAVHLSAAAFDRVAKRMADELFIKLESGDLDTGLAALLSKHGWTCTPPAAAKPVKCATVRKTRKGRK
jgi:hypothetical protein